MSLKTQGARDLPSGPGCGVSRVCLWCEELSTGGSGAG